MAQFVLRTGSAGRGPWLFNLSKDPCPRTFASRALRAISRRVVGSSPTRVSPFFSLFTGVVMIRTARLSPQSGHRPRQGLAGADLSFAVVLKPRWEGFSASVSGMNNASGVIDPEDLLWSLTHARGRAYHSFTMADNRPVVKVRIARENLMRNVRSTRGRI